MTDFMEKVKQYYPKVDSGDIDWIIDLFDDNGVYVRADVSYSGKNEIKDFYENDRKITGKHTVEKIFTENNSIAVNGVFEGVGADGAAKKVGFADFWTFKDNGKVGMRRTYLAIGSDYVKD